PMDQLAGRVQQVLHLARHIGRPDVRRADQVGWGCARRGAGAGGWVAGRGGGGGGGGFRARRAGPGGWARGAVPPRGARVGAPREGTPPASGTPIPPVADSPATNVSPSRSGDQPPTHFLASSPRPGSVTDAEEVASLDGRDSAGGGLVLTTENVPPPALGPPSGSAS